MQARRTDAPGHLAGIGSPEDEETTDVEHDAFELDTEPPPSYQDEGYEDEGFSGMTESIIGPISYNNYHSIYGNNPGWDFAGIPLSGARGGADDDEDAFGDAASDQPAMGDDPKDRLMQDFGDDVMNPGQNSRAMTPMSEEEMEEMPELVGNDGAVQVENMDMVGADDEVADVVVDEGDVGGGHAKMD
jgi:ubiquitin carboxyl-terminal hydrolase 4/11